MRPHVSSYRLACAAALALLAVATATAEPPKPALSIKQVLPATVAPGHPLSVEVIVTNDTTAPLEGVVVAGPVPKAYAVSKSEPEGTVDGSTLSWQVGALEAGGSKTLRVTLAPKADVEPDAELRFDFQASHRAVARDNRAVKVVRAEFGVAIDAPAEVELGQPFTAKVVVRNDGGVALSNITVRTGLVDGLSHPNGNDLESECPPLKPKESETVSLPLTPTHAGEAGAVVRVSCPGMPPVEREIRVKVREVKVALRATPAAEGVVDGETKCSAVVENLGEQPIAKLRLVLAVPADIEGLRGSNQPAMDAVARTVHWDITDLPPQKPVKIEWVCTAKKPGRFYFPLTLKAGEITRERTGIVMRVEPEAPARKAGAMQGGFVGGSATKPKGVEPVKPVAPPKDTDPNLVQPTEYREPAPKAESPARLPGALKETGVARVSQELPLPKQGPPGKQELPVPKPAGPKGAKVGPNLPLLPPPAKLTEPKSTEPEDGELLLAAARNSIKAGNYAEGLARFARYLAKNPNESGVRIEYAGALATAGRIPEAIAEYQAALASAPTESVRIRVAISDLYVQVKEYKLAVAQLLLARTELSPKAADAPRQIVDVTVRLVRAYLFDDCWTPALAEFDANLSKLRPTDDANSPLFALLLMDLDRAEAAVEFALSLKEPLNDDPQTYVALARAYSRLGDAVKAQEAVQTLASRHPTRLTIRLQLAETLAATGDYDLAENAYVALMQTSPDHAPTQLSYARMLIRLYRVGQARQILGAVPRTEPNTRMHMLACADAHAASGEYTDARNLYRSLLLRWPGDHEVRLLLAALCQSIGEFQKARAEACKIPPESWAGRQARLRQASVLVAEFKTIDALKVLEALALDYKHDPETVGELARALVKTGVPDRAEGIVLAYLANGAKSKQHIHAGQAALGRVLLDSHRQRDAISAYEDALLKTGPKDPYTVFGLALAYLRSGMADRASETSALATASPAGAIRGRMAFADRYLEEDEHQHAAEMATSILHADPLNPAAMIRLAEAKQGLARQTGDVKEALRAADGLLAGSPDNTRGLLVMARTLSLAKQYKESAGVYGTLVSQDDDLAVAKRELARTLYADRQYDKAHAAYLSAQSVPDQQFRGDLDLIARSSAKAHDVVSALLASQAPGAIVAPEVRKLSLGIEDINIKQALMSAAIDFEARASEAKAAGLEDVSKSNKDLRNWTAIPSYLDLIAHEPANVEALFDLGQVYGAQKLTHKAIDQFGRTLTVDDQSRESQQATKRAGLEMNPRVTLGNGYSKENGRDGLSRTSQARFSVLAEVPFDDENEVIGFGFTRAYIRPFNDKTLTGNILTATGSVKMSEQYLAYGVLNYEQYEGRFQDRPTFDAGVRFTGDQVTGEIAGYLENLPVNAEAMHQSIYRAGLRVSGTRQETRRWDYGGLYRFAGFSDDNFSHEVNLRTGFIVNTQPHQVRLIGSAELLAFNEQTTFGPFPTPRVEGSIHPYFAPEFFTFYRGGVEYTHYFSRDSFVYADVGYFTASAQLGWDDSFNGYYLFSGAMNYDATSWLTFRADARLTLSRVYDYVGVNLFAVFRMPFDID